MKKCQLAFPVQMIRFGVTFLKPCTLFSTPWGISVKHETAAFPTLEYNLLALFPMNPDG